MTTTQNAAAWTGGQQLMLNPLNRFHSKLAKSRIPPVHYIDKCPGPNEFFALSARKVPFPIVAVGRNPISFTFGHGDVINLPAVLINLLEDQSFPAHFNQRK